MALILPPFQIDPELPELLTVWGALAVGAALQGTVGFGVALFAAPILIMLDPGLVPGPLLMGVLLLTALTSYREWHAVRLSEVKWAMVGRIPGTILGAVILVLISRESAALSAGVLTIIGVIMCASTRRLAPTPANLVGAGVVSGFMGTTAAIGGPAMAMVYQTASLTHLRATLSVYFVVGVVVSLLALAVGGKFGAAEAWAGCLLMPGVVMGYLVSNRLNREINIINLRPVILVLSAMSGLAVIIQSPLLVEWFN